MFRGAEETLARHRPNLLVEIEQRHSPVPISETFDFLHARGYASYYLDGTRTRVSTHGFDHRRNQELCDGGRATGKTAPGYVSNFIFIPA